jgi:hypothetical protein
MLQGLVLILAQVHRFPTGIAKPLVVSLRGPKLQPLPRALKSKFERAVSDFRYKICVNLIDGLLDTIEIGHGADDLHCENELEGVNQVFIIVATPGYDPQNVPFPPQRQDTVLARNAFRKEFNLLRQYR